MADEIQTFKALITIHKVLQEGHPVVLKEAQQNINWVESLARGVNGEGLRGMPIKAQGFDDPWASYCSDADYSKGVLWLYSADTFAGYGPLIREYVFFLLAKLAFHRQHPEFNGRQSLEVSDCCANAEEGLFEYEEYISLKSINDPNEG